MKVYPACTHTRTQTRARALPHILLPLRFRFLSLFFIRAPAARPIALAKKPWELIPGLLLRAQETGEANRHPFREHFFALFPRSGYRRWHLRLIFIRYLDPRWSLKRATTMLGVCAKPRGKYKGGVVARNGATG